MTPPELAQAFFLAITVILLSCLLVARLLRPALQPPVVAEMLTGVLLGPSLLGAVWPSAERALFPAELRPILYVFGQVGLVVFMFGSGYELRTEGMRRIAAKAGPIAGVGMVVPFVLSVGLVLLARPFFDVRVPGVPWYVTVLFVGVAVSITAFPMMARIITERGLAGTHFGAVSLTAGAVDDVMAWILLAGVLSLSSASVVPVALATGGIIPFVLVLAYGRRRVPAAVSARVAPDRLVIGAVAVLMIAAWYTDRIGLYAVFGAFALGLACPRLPEVDRMYATIAPFCTLAFLPLFFTYSGLNTDFALLGDASVLLFALGCVVVAVAGKLIGCTLAARAVGEPPASALRIGALMNARGLMQLIALNVGLSAGIVSSELFTVLVLVALATTLMASPLIAWLDRRRPLPDPAGEPEPAPVTA